MAHPPSSASATPRPARSFLRPGSLALVFIGGTAGTAGRHALGLWLPSPGGLPIAILLANLLGAFLLGLLLEALARGGEDERHRRRLRLLLGTGFMGGFTTYSTLATDGMLLLASGAVPVGLGYVLGTVVLGTLATWCGITLGAKLSGNAKAGRS